MAIIPTIRRILNSRAVSIAPKVLGAATAAAVVYDSHINAKEKAYVTDEIESADRFSKRYNQYMSADVESASLNKMKKFWFDVQNDFQFLNIVSKIKGYVSGFFKTVLKCLPLVALSAVSIISKGNIGKVTGALLALNGIKTVLYDVMGIGAKDKSKYS